MTITDPSALQLLSELYDSILLRVPVQHLSARRVKADCLDAPRAELRMQWVTNPDVSLDSVVAELLDDFAQKYPNHLLNLQPSSGPDATRVSVVTATANPSQEGEPIPPDPSTTITLSLGDDEYSVVNYDGVEYTVLKNGEALGGAYSSASAALGAAMEPVLLSLAEAEASRGTPDPDQAVDRDFLFSVSQFLSKSSIIPDEAIRQKLVEVVETSTNRDFRS